MLLSFDLYCHVAVNPLGKGARLEFQGFYMHNMTRLGLCALVSLLAGCSGVAPQSDQDTDNSSFFGLYHSIQPVKANPPAALADKPALPKTTEAANEVLIQAMGLVGVKYIWGGEDPNKGFDCSGLIQHVFSEAIDVNLPRTSQAMSAMNVPVVHRDKLNSGDLLFFATSGGKRVTHVAIYVGDNRFIHAPRAGKNVSMSRLDNVYWNKHFVSAKRVITPQTLSTATRQKGDVNAI